MIKYFVPQNIVSYPDNTQSSPSSSDDLEGSDDFTDQPKKRRLGEEFVRLIYWSHIL